MNKANPFPDLAVPFLLLLHSNLSIAFESILLTNSDKISLEKGIATFANAFFA